MHVCLASVQDHHHVTLQEVNTEERVAQLSPSQSCGDLLSITSSKGGLKAEVATILGAQQFFHESGAPKRSVSPLLTPTWTVIAPVEEVQ